MIFLRIRQPEAGGDGGLTAIATCELCGADVELVSARYILGIRSETPIDVEPVLRHAVDAHGWPRCGALLEDGARVACTRPLGHHGSHVADHGSSRTVWS